MAEVMGIGMSMLNQGRRHHRKTVKESRNMLNVNTLDAHDVKRTMDLAVVLSTSSPASGQSWKHDLGAFSAIAVAHRRQWDRRAHKGTIYGHIVSTFQHYSSVPIFASHSLQYRTYSAMADRVCRIYADNIRGYTVPPEYYKTKGIYPVSEDINDKAYRSAIDRTLMHFRLHGNASSTVLRRYKSDAYRIELFHATGLSELHDVLAIHEEARMLRWTMTGAGKGNIGIKLHTTCRNRQGLIMAMIACQGSFQGERGWVFFTRTLIQGAWPWLGGYTKDYAKTIYLAMICLFTIVRQGSGYRPDIGQLILALAARLVDPNCFGLGCIRVRVNDKLAEDSVRYEPMPRNEKADPQSATVPSWTLSADYNPQLSSQSTQHACRHIVIGRACNHGPSLVFTGRFKVANSLEELQSYAASGQTIVVTRSFGNNDAIQEIEDFVTREKILSVRRDQKQCTACAVRLAHNIGAIVVVP